MSSRGECQFIQRSRTWLMSWKFWASSRNCRQMLSSCCQRSSHSNKNSQFWNYRRNESMNLSNKEALQYNHKKSSISTWKTLVRRSNPWMLQSKTRGCIIIQCHIAFTSQKLLKRNLTKRNCTSSNSISTMWWNLSTWTRLSLGQSIQRRSFQTKSEAINSKRSRKSAKGASVSQQTRLKWIAYSTSKKTSKGSRRAGTIVVRIERARVILCTLQRSLKRAATIWIGQKKVRKVKARRWSSLHKSGSWSIRTLSLAQGTMEQSQAVSKRRAIQVRVVAAPPRIFIKSNRSRSLRLTVFLRQRMLQSLPKTAEKNLSLNFRRCKSRMMMCNA